MEIHTADAASMNKAMLRVPKHDRDIATAEKLAELAEEVGQSEREFASLDVARLKLEKELAAVNEQLPTAMARRAKARAAYFTASRPVGDPRIVLREGDLIPVGPIGTPGEVVVVKETAIP